jgi:hypothetical protein
LNSPKLKVKIKNNGVDTYIFMAFIFKKDAEKLIEKFDVNL